MDIMEIIVESALSRWIVIKGNPDIQMKVVFEEDGVKFIGKRYTRIIKYKNIKEVQRIISFGQSAPKGYHRVKIKCKGKNMVFFTNSKEQEKELFFEECTIGKMYDRLREHGVKCC